MKAFKEIFALGLVSFGITWMFSTSSALSEESKLEFINAGQSQVNTSKASNVRWAKWGNGQVVITFDVYSGRDGENKTVISFIGNPYKVTSSGFGMTVSNVKFDQQTYFGGAREFRSISTNSDVTRGSDNSCTYIEIDSNKVINCTVVTRKKGIYRLTVDETDS